MTRLQDLFERLGFFAEAFITNSQGLGKMPTFASFFVLALIGTFTLFGCGGEENITSPIGEETGNDAPKVTSPNYYPMTIGSWWRYRNPDGSEWMREVSGTIKTDNHVYHFFRYNSPREEDYQPAFAKVSLRLVPLVKYGEIGEIVWNEIYKGKSPDTLGILWMSNTKVSWHSVLKLMPLPLHPNSTWDVFEIRFSGGEHSPIETYSYETKWIFTGQSSGYQVIETPTGKFENCLQIQYKGDQHEIEIKDFWHVDQELAGKEVFFNSLEKALLSDMTELYKRLLSRLHLQTIWLAPGVGPVKIETPNSIAELIDYDIKPVE